MNWEEHPAGPHACRYACMLYALMNVSSPCMQERRSNNVKADEYMYVYGIQPLDPDIDTCTQRVKKA